MNLEQLKQTKLYQSLFRKLGNDVDFPDIETALLEVVSGYFAFNRDADTLLGAFHWNSSPKGFAYWESIYNRWRQNEYNF